MTYLFKLARRTARQRTLPLIALAATLAACDTDRLTNSSEAPAATEVEPVSTPAPLFASGFRGGIPFGTFALPTNEFGPVYNGAHRNLAPEVILAELAAIKSQGGRVVLMFAGNEQYYRENNHRFSLTKWKARVDRFKGINFSSYIEDGTIIGHYLIDEPNDDFNWGGQAIPGSVVEQMAGYSKQLWPKMGTIVRTEPGYMLQTGGPYRYLDAAWAQYAARKGSPQDYFRRNVADAQRAGLALIAGMNISLGGPTGGEMSASLVQSVGSALLAESYPCAFINWQWRAPYMARADIKAAMANLSAKAAAHGARSCSSSTATPPPPPPNPPTLPGVRGIVLTAVKTTQNGHVIVKLSWTGANGRMVDFYRNRDLRRTIPNDGSANAYPGRAGTYTYKVCEARSTRCSESVSVPIR